MHGGLSLFLSMYYSLYVCYFALCTLSIEHFLWVFVPFSETMILLEELAHRWGPWISLKVILHPSHLTLWIFSISDMNICLSSPAADQLTHPQRNFCKQPCSTEPSLRFPFIISVCPEHSYLTTMRLITPLVSQLSDKPASHLFIGLKLPLGLTDKQSLSQ